MKNRLIKVRNLLTEQHLDAAIISSVANTIYLTGFLGFSKEERDAHLLITKTHAYIFTNALYSEAVYKKVPHFVLTEITSASPFVESFKKLILKHKIKILGVEENDLRVSEYKKLSSLKAIRVNHINTENLRSIKDSREIQQIAKACEISDKAFNHILEKLKTGVTEQEIAFELEIFMKRNGADASFRPIVAFGSHSSIPHHKSNSKQLTANSIVLLDFGARYNGYCSDMTRTIFFGKATAEQKHMYQTVLAAQQKSIDYINTSDGGSPEPVEGHDSSEVDQIKASDVDKTARNYIISQGYPTIPHSLGHGIGLQVHESPSLSPKSKDVLQEGMVFSIEPGIYLPAGRQGMKGTGGIRIEDLFTIQNGKLVQLTNSSKNLIELQNP